MAQGQGFVNVTNGIGTVFGSLFGQNGAADELAIIFNKNGQAVTVPVQPQPATGSNNTLFIIIAIIAIVGVIFLIKK
jgi:hypothetical protein